MEKPRVKREIFLLVCDNHAHTQRKSNLRGVGKPYRLQWDNNSSSDGKGRFARVRQVVLNFKYTFDDEDCLLFLFST